MTIFSFLKNDFSVAYKKYLFNPKVFNPSFLRTDMMSIREITPVQSVKINGLTWCSIRQIYGLTWCSIRLIYKYIQGYINPLYIYIYSPTACAHKIHQTKFTMQNF